MDTFVDVFGETVFLDDDVKQVVFAKHLEVKELWDHIESVLNDPDLVERSKLSKRANLYYRYFAIF